MGVGGCLKFILFFVALWCAPVAVAAYKFFAPEVLCDGTMFLSLFLYGGVLICSTVIGFLGPSSNQSIGTLNLVYLIAFIASVLAFVCAVHAICVVCGCRENTRYPQSSMHELGKSRNHGGGGEEVPTHLNVQSSYMICDCRGQKSKNGLFRMRVPRGVLRQRKEAEAQKDEETNLSTDDSFEEERDHMRRAMMPYVGKRAGREKNEESAGSDNEGESSGADGDLEAATKPPRNQGRRYSVSREQ